MKYCDLHCDTAYECFLRNEELVGNGLAVDLSYARLFEKWHQVFAFWIPEAEPHPYALFNKILADFERKRGDLPESFSYTLAVEGGAVIERDIGRVAELHKHGIRIMSLTWNNENALAGGCKSLQGLSRLGKRVISEMNRLGMVCDLSHLNDRSFSGVIEKADRVMASHSLSRSVYDHPRNLTDEQARLIADRDGLIGICFFPAFLGGDTFEKIYAHISHLLDLGLLHNIAIGSDFDGAAMDHRLCTVQDIPSLYFKLSEKGIPDRTLDKIFYENARNYLLNL